MDPQIGLFLNSPHPHGPRVPLLACCLCCIKPEQANVWITETWYISVKVVIYSRHKIFWLFLRGRQRDLEKLSPSAMLLHIQEKKTSTLNMLWNPTETTPWVVCDVTHKEEFIKCYVCLFSRLEEPSKQSREWQRSRKGHRGSVDFYCESEGLEVFLSRHTKTDIPM